jgi:UDP-glucose 6-dehydrogenase
LTPNGFKRPLGIRYFVRFLDTLPLFHPTLSLLFTFPRMLIKAARALRVWKQQREDPSYRLLRLVLSKLPENGVTAILGLANHSNPDAIDNSQGLALARSLLGGGYPVIVYDPEPAVMKKAQSTLGGPVQFASSVEECVRESDVIVITTPREEFAHIPMKALVRESTPRVLIDCCQLLQTQLWAGAVDYISW